MPDPKEVYDHPERFREFLTAKTATGFEGQHFDRKEACRADASGAVSSNHVTRLVEQIKECISAFANINKAGGLLALGIDNNGEVRGIEHLSENQRNRLTNINAMLVNQSASVKVIDLVEEDGTSKKICLIYVPYTEHGICETLGNSPKAWVRQDTQNLPLSDAQKEQLKRDKKIVDFENAFCCRYDPADIDRSVLDEFRKVFLEGAAYEYSDEEILYEAGAIIKCDSGYAFTNAGFLFFASNPQRVLPASVIRLLRFEAIAKEIDRRGLPTFEREFSGPITKQIRNMRTFFRESAFFKTYQRRNPEGGFIEEPEYPFIAVDEAIVNAVAHRDYAVKLPIESESYKDALLVRNPGRIQQRDHDVPEHFSLAETTLVSAPRNPQLIKWLRLMKDERGTAFVRALSEGTKRMRDEMAKLHLPAPRYEVSATQTTLFLYNDSEEREAQLKSSTDSPSTEHANLYPLTFRAEGGRRPDRHEIDDKRRDIVNSLRDRLVVKGWYVDSIKFGKIIAHRRAIDIQLPEEVAGFVKFFPAYSFQLREYNAKFYLCIDYTLEVKNVLTVQRLLGYLNQDNLVGTKAVARWLKGWHRAKILAADKEYTKLYFFDFNQEAQVPSDAVIPNLGISTIERLLAKAGIRFDLSVAIKRHSLSLEPNAARTRLEKTQATAELLAEVIFPIRFDGISANLQPTPVSLQRHRDSASPFPTFSLSEPNVEFNRHHEAADIREGIIKFGAFNETPRTIEIVPICTTELRDGMWSLIERLKGGKYKYKGSERTFRTRFTYQSVITTPSPESSFRECERLLNEHPEWVGDNNLNRIFLVHCPERGYSIDDESSPYYRVKRLLLEKGVPCQMVDTPTLQNADWKDLNLALNLVSKCGVTPWVLPDAIPDADFFVGLSYTQSSRREGERLMGYANVFNQYGRWEFYSGNTEAFDYDQRAILLKKVVKDTLSRLTLSETPSIYFHYSARFSKIDRAAILEAARSIRPQGIYTFVWVNTDHNVRLYDTRPETDGSLSRGSYVVTSPNQFYLSTTGYNPYRKVLGTPKMLEVNVWVERPNTLTRYEPDLKALAVQILSLTKLNWASTDSLCGEPITTKYAHDIAYLTLAFLRQGEVFRLHPTLEKTPWFI